MWRASQAVDCNMWQRLSHENLAHSSWSNLGHDQIRKIKSKFQASGGMRQIRQATLAIRKFCQTRCICCCGFMFKWNNSILQHDNWIRAADVELPWSHTHCRIQRLWVFDYCFTNWPLFGFHSSLRRNNCRALIFQVFLDQDGVWGHHLEYACKAGYPWRTKFPIFYLETWHLWWYLSVKNCKSMVRAKTIHNKSRLSLLKAVMVHPPALGV